MRQFNLASPSCEGLGGGASFGAGPHPDAGHGCQSEGDHFESDLFDREYAEEVQVNEPSQVSIASEISLMMALQRLMDGGHPLTIRRLSQEAGLHISTVNRSPRVLEKLRLEKRLRIGEMGRVADAKGAERKERLEDRLAGANARAREWRDRAEGYAAHIQFLELSIRALADEPRADDR
jgi:predicted transcriptional regulator